MRSYREEKFKGNKEKDYMQIIARVNCHVLCFYGNLYIFITEEKNSDIMFTHF